MISCFRRSRSSLSVIGDADQPTNITVTDNNIGSIAVKTAPTDMKYLENTQIDLDGIVVVLKSKGGRELRELTKEEYIDIVISQLELLQPKIVIHRITGDPKKEDLITPTWLLKKFCVLNDIDKEMKKRENLKERD